MARKKNKLHVEYDRLQPDKIRDDLEGLKRQKEQKIAEINAIAGAITMLEQLLQPTPTGHGMNRAAARRAQREAKKAAAASKATR